MRTIVATVVATLGLAVLIASPAAAQSFDPSVGTGNIVRPYDARPQYPTGVDGSGSLRGTYLYAGPRYHRKIRRHAR
jgi:hypothetical protein